MYNLYKIEEKFRYYLLAEKAKKGKPIADSTLRNYLSDLRFFLKWGLAETKSRLEYNSILEFITSCDNKTILKYKEFLKHSALPSSTIKRRISSLRKFFGFCISQNWINQNPVRVKKSILQRDPFLLSRFKNFLRKEKKLPEKTIEKVLLDIKDLLSVNSPI